MSVLRFIPMLRSDLLEQLTSAPAMSWVVEATGGAGKTVLARQLAERLGDDAVALHVDELDNLRLDAVPIDCVAIIDIAVGTDTATDVALANRMRNVSAAPTILFTRRAGARVLSLTEQHLAGYLTTSDLYLPRDAVADLASRHLGAVADTNLVDEVWNRSHGWPSQAAAMIAALASLESVEGRTAYLADSRRLFRGLRKLYDDLSPGAATALTVLAELESFDHDMVTMLDQPDLISNLCESGFPAVERGDGWWCFLAPVRRVIRELAAEPTLLPVDVVDHMIAENRCLDATEACISLGQRELAAERFSRFTVEHSRLLPPEDIDTMWTLIGPEALDCRPRSYLVKSWVSARHGEYIEAERLLSQGISLAESAGTDQRHVVDEMKVELAFQLSWALELDRAEQSLQNIRSDAALPVQALAAQVRGEIAAQRMTPKSIEDAIVEFNVARDLFAEVADEDSAELASVGLAREVYFRLGKFTPALAIIDRSLARKPPAAQAGTFYLTRSRCLMGLGQLDAARSALLAAEDQFQLAQVDWALGMVETFRAIIAGAERDEFSFGLHANAALKAFAAHVDETASGSQVLLSLAESAARCGLRTRALAYLDGGRDHPAADPPSVSTSEVVVESRVGDARRALELISVARAGPWVTDGGPWRLTVAEAIATHRLGDNESAQRLLDAAADERAALGEPGDPAPLDGEFTRLIRASSRPAVPAESPAAPSSPLAATDYRVTLFGGFELTHHGEPVDMPRGRVPAVIKLVILNGGYLTTDVLTDALWGDVTIDVGRRRLRNVLSRVRAVCGDSVTRTGDLIEMDASKMSSDYGDWWARSAEVLSTSTTSPSELSEVAKSADAELLPGDRYTEWLQPHLRHFATRRLILLDRLAVRSRDGGDVDRAVDAWTRATELDPGGTDRFEALSAMLIDHGRADEARLLRQGIVPE